MRYILLSLLFPLVHSLSSQVTASFENFNLPPDTFLNNAAPNDAFVSEPVALPNNYNPQWMAWTGWAISNRTDTLTPGFINEYSAMAGSGANGTATYAVAYAFDGAIIRLLGPASGGTVLGLYVTNNAYAYYSMRDGDPFAKKFGGPTGNDPDFFLLTIKKYRNGVLGPDSVNFYLADYRFADNTRDYIIKDWTYVDLSSLGEVDSLLFTLTSSDVGVFGMNTPAYFCIDEVSIQPTVSQKEAIPALDFALWPNPASNDAHIRLPESALAEAPQVEVFDAAGRLLLQTQEQHLSVATLSPGLYYVRVQTPQGVGVRPLQVVR